MTNIQSTEAAKQLVPFVTRKALLSFTVFILPDGFN